MTIKEFIERLQTRYQPEMECAVALWQPDDVRESASERDIKLTDEEVSEVLSSVQRKQDCEIGINWDVINCWIDEVVSRR